MNFLHEVWHEIRELFTNLAPILEIVWSSVRMLVYTMVVISVLLYGFAQKTPVIFCLSLIGFVVLGVIIYGVETTITNRRQRKSKDE